MKQNACSIAGFGGVDRLLRVELFDSLKVEVYVEWKPYFTIGTYMGWIVSCNLFYSVDSRYLTGCTLG